MSVKKSSTTSKSSSARRKNNPATPSGNKDMKEQEKLPTVSEDVASPEPANNVSARASRKVAAERKSSEGEMSDAPSITPGKEQCEGNDSVKVIPSRRVWPD